MPRLSPCPSCHVHVLAHESSCPHCGGTIRAVAGRGAVVLMGLALAGCPVDAEPEYGVPDTDTAPMDSSSSGSDTADTDMTAEPEYGVPDTSDTSTETSGSTAPEPDYGVPDTSTETTGGEPEYGAPDTGP